MERTEITRGRWIAATAAAVAVVLAGAAATAAVRRVCPAGPLTGEVTRVRDGDTIEVAGIVS